MVRSPLLAGLLLLAASPAEAATFWRCQVRALPESRDPHWHRPQPEEVYRVERRRVWSRDMFGNRWHDLCQPHRQRVVRQRCATSRRGFRVTYVVEFEPSPYRIELDFATGRLEHRRGRTPIVLGTCAAEASEPPLDRSWRDFLF